MYRKVLFYSGVVLKSVKCMKAMRLLIGWNRVAKEESPLLLQQSPVVEPSEDSNAGVPHRINIIDTQAGIDFTAEVERSLRVLDGPWVSLHPLRCNRNRVLVVDKYRVSELTFINKMDRMGSDFNGCRQYYEEKLGRMLTPLLGHWSRKLILEV